MYHSPLKCLGRHPLHILCISATDLTFAFSWNICVMAETRSLSFPGYEPGRQEREPPPVQVPRQILPRRRGRGTHPGYHLETVLPPSEKRYIVRRNILPTRNVRPIGLVRRTSKAWRLPEGLAQSRVPR